MMLAVLDVRLKELLAFLCGDDDRDDVEGAGEEDASLEAFLGDEYRCFFWGEALRWPASAKGAWMLTIEGDSALVMLPLREGKAVNGESDNGDGDGDGGSK